MSKRLKIEVALLAVAMLVVGLVAPIGASAQAQQRATVHGGSTTLTTAPKLAQSLLGHKIVALVTAPGTQTLRKTASGPQIIARYPVTRGAVSTNPLRGRYGHRGGLFITNLGNGKVVAVDNFIVDVTHKVLTAHLIGPNVRATVFDLNFGRAKTVVRKGFISISGIGVRLAGAAATVLNSALGTKVFTPGMRFGTAVSRLDR